MYLLMPDCLAHLAYGDGGCDDRRRPLAMALARGVGVSVGCDMTENRNSKLLIFSLNSKFAREAGSGRRTRYLTSLLSSPRASTCRHT